MSPRTKLRSLLRGTPSQGAPLFLPIACALGSAVEALRPLEFLANPTKLAKGLQGLQQSLAIDGVFCAAPSALEAEALGATLDWRDYPPPIAVPAAAEGDLPASALEQIANSARVAAALEATRRLAATAAGEPVLAIALSGPLRLAQQLAGERFLDQLRAASDQPIAILELAGRALSSLAKSFGEAGINLILLQEQALPATSPAAMALWQAALRPILNIARFHKALPVVQVDMQDSDWVALLPAGAMPCVRYGAAAPQAGNFAVALTSLESVAGLDARVCMVTTTRELPATADLPTLRAQCQVLRAAF